MSRTLTLVAKVDDDFGTLGLVIKGAGHAQVNSASEGLLIAHDIIEHVNGLSRIGPIDDELEALGAIWTVRGQFCDIARPSRSHGPEDDIASDVTRMCVDMLHGAYYPYPRGRPLRTVAHEHDEAFRTILDKARHDIPAEYSERLTHAQASHVEGYLLDALHYMRRGARKLTRRYPDAMAANRQFWAIAEAVEPYAKHAELEGMRYRLIYGNGEATCSEIYDDDY